MNSLTKITMPAAMQRMPVLLLALLLLAGAMPQAGAVARLSHADRRLSRDVAPDAYELAIEPNLANATFKGSETIELHVDKQPAGTILLNSLDLAISAVQLAGADGASLPASFHLVPHQALLEVVPARPLPAGKYRLHLRFAGKLNDKLVGFYRSTYKDAKGSEHTLAVTQMEPADARRMFPCFDEPSFKATFRLTVRTARNLAAVTNAPLEKQVENGDGTVTRYFAATPRMSSYLVALVVGELEATEPAVVDGVPIRVWCASGRKALGTYSRDEAGKLLQYLTGYFGIAYPWKKLDLIAIPDFEAGAMENPGAITFRETLLLIDPQTASSRAKRSASSVIAHEMAHLWFGDLVTMSWWDDLWLNEAFATWMATRAVNAVHPDWDEWKEYAESRLGALKTDGLKSTRAIHAEVSSPEQAHEMFDVITYEKGCSILRMLECFVGEPVFQKGVHDFLQAHAFANATTGDLWSAIGTAAGAPVAKIMDGWVHQPGYPLLVLSATPVPAGGAAASYEARQERFFEKGKEGEDAALWQVPVGMRSLAATPDEHKQTPAKQTQVLDTRTGELSCSTCSAGQVLLANAGGVGYYRSQYPAGAYEAIIAAVETKADPAERLAILSDTWALAARSDLSIDTYLALLTAMRSDKDELVWNAMISQLESMDYFIQADRRPAFQRFVNAQLAPLDKWLGWQPKPGETQQVRMLRARMLEALGTFGQNARTIAQARRLYGQLSSSKQAASAIDPDLLSPITTIVAYNGGNSEFAYFNSKWQKARTPEEYIRNLMALAQFHKPQLVDRVLAMSISGQVKTQDAPSLLGRLLSRRDTNAHAWQFIEQNWQKITSLYPEEMVPHVVSHAASFTTEPDYQRVKAFVSTHRIKSGKAAVARMLERVEINLRFRKNAAPRLNDWLNQHYGNV